VTVIATRDCVRCGTAKVQLSSVGLVSENASYEIAFSCNNCRRLSIYKAQSSIDLRANNLNIDTTSYGSCEREPVLNIITVTPLSDDIPPRIAEIFLQAAKSRRMQMFDASGAMFRKAIDVSTKHMFAIDPRLAGKNPADALRVRIKALSELKILEDDIVELADVVAVDGNDAAHEMDPYTAEEAEALEDLTLDLLDRLFVRPARVARVKAKQVAAGQRKA
jgi:predicted nucleic-acid-binding Zn-ribbon protein